MVIGRKERVGEALEVKTFTVTGRNNQEKSAKGAILGDGLCQAAVLLGPLLFLEL